MMFINYGGYYTMTDELHDYVVIDAADEIRINTMYESYRYGPLPGIY